MLNLLVLSQRDLQKKPKIKLSKIVLKQKKPNEKQKRQQRGLKKKDFK